MDNLNETIQLMMNHRTIRAFEDKTLSDEQVKTLVQAAQMAPTSSHRQVYSIIGITDPEVKKELREISGQPYVEANGHLFVFVADHYRHSQLEGFDAEVMTQTFETTEGFIVGVVDAALAAQSLNLAAESLGLGACFLGSLRNDIKRVSELLQLPPYTMPVFGLAVGYPTDEGSQKERLPMDVVYHENTYETEGLKEKIAEYDESIRAYYQSRDENKKDANWTNIILKSLQRKYRYDVDDYVKSQGFLKQ
mgnify:FL=1